MLVILHSSFAFYSTRTEEEKALTDITAKNYKYISIWNSAHRFITQYIFETKKKNKKDFFFYQKTIF
uniref:Uncharacterized protein n=1 Tax=Octopus bimaculoides TaxID=37653 RepID=A0A0L8H6Y6_OCTBM